jgi:serine-type D-Ala-D-Ala carboxypeptidase
MKSPVLPQQSAFDFEGAADIPASEENATQGFDIPEAEAGRSDSFNRVTLSEPYADRQDLPLREAGRFNYITQIVNQAVGESVFPGGVVLLGRNDQIVFWRAFGNRAVEGLPDVKVSPVLPDMVYDVGQLTRSVVTATLMMKLQESGKVALDDRVSRYLQTFGVFGKSGVTIGQLLAHCAGLAAVSPFYEELQKQNTSSRMGIMASKGARDMVVNSINRSQLKYAPGTRQFESDNGFILLGELVELLTGMSLEKAAFKHVFRPLGMKSSSYIDLSILRRRGYTAVEDIIAPTEACSWRKKVLCGEVMDDNAWAMGGISGHSGLFSTAMDLHAFAAGILQAYRGEGEFLQASTVRRFWRMTEAREEQMCYGWDVPRKENGLAACQFSNRAIGADSSTGCSLWIEPKEGLQIILLTNSAHPNRSEKKMRGFRPVFFDAALQALRSI